MKKQRVREEATVSALPDDMMLYYGQVRPVVAVEAEARRQMAGFDHLPRKLRMISNAFAVDPVVLAQEMCRNGTQATYDKWMEKFANGVVKARPGARRK